MDKSTRLTLQQAIQNLPSALSSEGSTICFAKEDHLAQFEHLTYSTYDLQVLSKTVAQVLTEHPELDEATVWPQWLSRFNKLYEYAADLRRLIHDTFDQECTLIAPLTVQIPNNQEHIVKERTLSLPITLEWESVGITSLTTAAVTATEVCLNDKEPLGIILTPQLFKSIIVNKAQDTVSVNVLFNEELMDAQLHNMLSCTLFTKASENFKISLEPLLTHLATSLQRHFSQERHGALVNNTEYSLETSVKALNMQTISKQSILEVLSTV